MKGLQDITTSYQIINPLNNNQKEKVTSLLHGYTY